MKSLKQMANLFLDLTTSDLEGLPPSTCCICLDDVTSQSVTSVQVSCHHVFHKDEGGRGGWFWICYILYIYKLRMAYI